MKLVLVRLWIIYYFLEESHASRGPLGKIKARTPFFALDVLLHRSSIDCFGGIGRIQGLNLRHTVFNIDVLSSNHNSRYKKNKRNGPFFCSTLFIRFIQVLQPTQSTFYYRILDCNDKRTKKKGLGCLRRDKELMSLRL